MLEHRFDRCNVEMKQERKAGIRWLEGFVTARSKSAHSNFQFDLWILLSL